jgi:hypothetical protein
MLIGELLVSLISRNQWLFPRDSHMSSEYTIRVNGSDTESDKLMLLRITHTHVRFVNLLVLDDLGHYNDYHDVKNEIDEGKHQENPNQDQTASLIHINPYTGSVR